MTAAAEIKLDPAGYADREFFRRVGERLAQLEEDCGKLTMDECADELEGSCYQTSRITGSSRNLRNDFVISADWSESGVRRFVALIRLNELIVSAMDVKDLEQEPAAAPLSGKLADLATDDAPKPNIKEPARVREYSNNPSINLGEGLCLLVDALEEAMLLCEEARAAKVRRKVKEAYELAAQALDDKRAMDAGKETLVSLCHAAEFGAMRVESILISLPEIIRNESDTLASDLLRDSAIEASKLVGSVCGYQIPALFGVPSARMEATNLNDMADRYLAALEAVAEASS